MYTIVEVIQSTTKMYKQKKTFRIQYQFGSVMYLSIAIKIVTIKALKKKKTMMIRKDHHAREPRFERHNQLAIMGSGILV